MDFSDVNSLSQKGRFELLENRQGWLIGRFKALSELGFPHIITTKQGPDTFEIRDYPEHILAVIGRSMGYDQVAYLTQVHGPIVLEARQGGVIGQADGLFTRRQGLVLAGRSADCPLVLVADQAGTMVGFAHASWRSTVAGVVPNLVHRMVGNGAKADSLIACIAPSIGPECYEVGEDVRRAALTHIGPHAVQFFCPGPVKDHFDLWRANCDALLRSGLLHQHIHMAGLCTACHLDVFPSYRREKEHAGRFVAAIVLP